MPSIKGPLIGINPFDLPGIRRLAELSGIELLQQPSFARIDELFEVWGNQTAFEKSAPAIAAALKLESGDVPDAEVLDLLEGTETLDGFGVRTVIDYRAPQGAVVGVAAGATIRWMEYRVRQLAEARQTGRCEITKIYALTDPNRVCNLSTELSHPIANKLKLDRPMTESEAMHVLLDDAGLSAEFIEVGNLELNATELMRKYPMTAHAKIYCPVNANATYIALALRRFICQAQPSFDRDFNQFYLSQNGVLLARTPDQAADTMHYQRPLTVFSGLVRLIKELYQLQQL